ncbi:MAG: DNA polymerase III subunit gamma/tau [Bacteroidales bacterium]|nr:DNA polymerase III subunit gamma/tau [Bacteroidales bacterium]
MAQYIVSARKYRPDSFESLIGQDNIARTLKNSILRGQLAHAYLFCGPRGVGKTSAARIFAKTINCAHPTADMEPCGKCESCVSFREGRSYCIHELDAASNNGVEDIKALMEQVQIPPQVGKYSVYIIDEVHMLTQSAFNAFLKTLEEPPAHAIFILATTEKHKIIPTILSRCQTYDFNRISVPDIVRNLRDIAGKEGVNIDEESLHVIAHKADGAMRDALTIFDQTVAFCGSDIHYEDVIRNLNVLDYEYSFKLVDAFLAKDYGTALLTFDEILSKGFNALHFVSALGSHLRDLLVSRTGGLEALLDLPDSLRQRYREQAGRCPLKFLYEALGIISQCEAGYRAATNQRLHIEFALMRLAFLGGVPEVAVASQPDGSKTADVKPADGVAPSGPSAPTQRKWEGPAPSGVGGIAPEGRSPEGVTSVAGNPGEAETAAPEAAAPVATPAVAARPRKKASGLSLSSLMSDDEITVELATDGADAAPAELPDAEAITAKWPELAAMYTSQPRLANALATAKLDVKQGDGTVTVGFALTNEAQKNWIAEKMLRSLEDRFQKLMNCKAIRLEPGVVPAEEQGQRIYMPVEKAQDLMSKNSEVSELIKDLALDIR